MECGVCISFRVVRELRTLEEVSEFFGNEINHTTCPSCGCLAVAPVRVRIRIEEVPSMSHDFIPYHIVETPEVMKDLLKSTPPGVHQVFTMAELHTAILARTIIELQRQQQCESAKLESAKQSAWQKFSTEGGQLVLGI